MHKITKTMISQIDTKKTGDITITIHIIITIIILMMITIIINMKRIIGIVRIFAGIGQHRGRARS